MRGRRRTRRYSGLQRVVAVVRVRWHYNAARGFVRGLPAEPLGTSRRNTAPEERGGRKGSAHAGRRSVAKHGKNITSRNQGESESESEARRGEEEEEIEEEEEKERAKAERDREFERARVFLNVVCART